MSDNTTRELDKRFKELDSERSPFRQTIIGAAFALRAAQDLANKHQEWELAAELRDQTLQLLHLLD